MAEGELSEIYEIRKRNLDVLLAEAKSLEAIGDAMRRAMQAKDPDAAGKGYANTLSQYKNGKRMGSRFARKLEASMGKPRGWMDKAQYEQAELDIDAKEAGQIIMGMEPDEREAWMRLLRNARRPKGPGNPFPDVPKGGKGGTQ